MAFHLNNRLSLGRGSVALARILYSGPFLYNLDSNGNMVSQNKGYDSDLLMYSGRYLDLVNQPTPIPIHHTLGADIINASAAVIDCTYNGDDTWTATADSGYFLFVANDTVPTNTYKTVIFEFEVTVLPAGGAYAIIEKQTPWKGTGNIPVVLGRNTVIFTATSVTAWYPRICINVSGETIGVINRTLKQITNPNSFLTYHDIANDEIITLGNSVDGGNSKELVANGTFNSDINGWNTYNASLSRVSNQLVVSSASIGNHGTWATSESIPCIIGRTYKVKYNFINAFGYGIVRVLNDPRAPWGFIYDETLLKYSEGTFSFTATQNNHYLALGGISTLGTNTYTFDSISIKEILPLSQTYSFDNIKVNNILAHKANFSTADRAKIEANPNLIGALAMSATGSIPELDHVLDAEDKWYPCFEKSGKYLVDARAGYGSALIDSSFYTGGSTLNCTVNGERLKFNSFDDAYYYKTLDIGLTVVEVTYTIENYVSGKVFVGITATNTTTPQSGNGTYTESIVVTTASSLNRPIVRAYDIRGFVGDVINLSIKEATASEIANYTTLARKKAYNKGIQTTAFELDAVGVPTAYNVSQLNFHGSEWGDTGWIPDVTKDWVLDCVLPKAKINLYEGIGIEDSNNGFWVRRSGGTISARLGINNEINYDTHDEYPFIRLKYTVSDGLLRMKVNDNLATGTSSNTNVNIVSSFTLGKINKVTNKNMNNPILMFNVQYGTTTDTEDTQAYNTWLETQGA